MVGISMKLKSCQAISYKNLSCLILWDSPKIWWNTCPQKWKNGEAFSAWGPVTWQDKPTVQGQLSLMTLRTIFTELASDLSSKPLWKCFLSPMNWCPTNKGKGQINNCCNKGLFYAIIGGAFLFSISIFLCVFFAPFFSGGKVWPIIFWGFLPWPMETRGRCGRAERMGLAISIAPSPSWRSDDPLGLAENGVFVTLPKAESFESMDCYWFFFEGKNSKAACQKI